MKTLAKKLRPLLKQHTELIDLIIFGSTTKNAITPNDIDVAALTTSPFNSAALKKEIEKKLDTAVDLQVLTLHDYDKFIWITLLREGYSIKHANFIHTIYNITPLTLYKYSLKELTPSKKVMFERAIKKFTFLTKLSNSVVLVPVTHANEFDEFLKQWNLDIDTRHYGLLPLVRKEES